MDNQKVRIKPLSRIILEGRDEDQSPEAIYVASEVDLVDKAGKNAKEAGKDPKEIEKKKTDLLNQYKEITGHVDTKKSIPEAKMQEVVSVFEGLLQDLGIKGWNEFGQKYGQQVKGLVADIGGDYIGYTYDPPTQTIAIVTTTGIGKYYFDTESQEFDQYQVQNLNK